MILDSFEHSNVAKMMRSIMKTKPVRGAIIERSISGLALQYSIAFSTSGGTVMELLSAGGISMRHKKTIERRLFRMVCLFNPVDML